MIRKFKSLYAERTCRDYHFLHRGEVAGRFRIQKLSDKVGVLWCVYIEQPLQGRGLGKKLVRDAITLARRYGFKELRLQVFNDNEPAKAIYRKAGFTLSGMGLILDGVLELGGTS